MVISSQSVAKNGSEYGGAHQFRVTHKASQSHRKGSRNTHVYSLVQQMFLVSIHHTFRRSSMETHAMKLLALSLWVAVHARRGLAWFFNQQGCWVLHTMCISKQWPRSVTLHGLPLHGLVAMVSKHSHFAVISFTVDQWISRRKEISQSNLLQQ